MKDRVKCRIIDALLMGEELFVVRVYEGSALATRSQFGVEHKLFCWEHPPGDWHHIKDKYGIEQAKPTLKQCLQIVEDCWLLRLKPANEPWQPGYWEPVT